MGGQQHDSEHTKQFFDRWHLYQQIIENDYMAHQSIHRALKRFVVSRIDRPFTLLDLGCGDASAIPGTFAGTGLQSYTGIDLSPVALEQAAENLRAVPFEVHLVEEDFTRYLVHNDSGRFHVILVGFALHHLYPAEKCEFFKRCYATLAPSGYLLVYDIFRRPGETRNEYIQSYCRHCGEQWTQLSPEGLVQLGEHINACDFPETYDTLATMASDAGFMSMPTPLFADNSQFHCLYSFQTNSGMADSWDELRSG
jgi:SAM-dependent methyltransferase